MKNLKKSFASLFMFSALLQAAQVPADLKSEQFSGSDVAPCPAVICAAPTGEVFVGVDLQGSLGKTAHQGKIVRLIDTDGDGKADQHSDYATIDNPRGLISIGDKLYVLHCTLKDGKPYGQQVSVYTDANNDGVADGAPKALIKGIGNPKFVQSRGADHCTNNIRLGIDGWIYIAVGDFGFIDAEGTDGKKLSMHGGGVVRFRPDGSELETFIHGTRNVYDVSIDPFMNIFTRENTNDGVGWWVRVSHYIQSAEYGYPSLYTNFPEDMLPSLGEYGGGSGVGAMYLQEPTWPSAYNNLHLLADWGTSQIYKQELTANGASFTTKQSPLIRTSQVTDLDMDASGRMYIAQWAGAGYKGNKSKGFVDCVVPKNWKYEAFPKLSSVSDAQLITFLKSASITKRTYASQEILRRQSKSSSSVLKTLIADKKNSREARVAAVYTLAQLKGKSVLSELQSIARDKDLREHAIRCMTDRLDVAKEANVKFLAAMLKDKDARVQVAAAVALGRTAKKEAAEPLVALAKPGRATAVAQKEIPKEAFISKPVSSKQQEVLIDADISSFKIFYLIVGGRGPSLAWVDPVIHTKDGKKIDLLSLKWISGTTYKGEIKVNKSGKTLQDNKSRALKGLGITPNSVIEYALPKNAVRFTARGVITKTKKIKGSLKFVVSPKLYAAVAPSKPHSTANADVILPHISRQALLSLDARAVAIAGLNSKDSLKISGALATLKFMHSADVVEALITKAKTSEAKLKRKIAETLIRLHQREVDYDGSTWWSTRPDPHGPYFYPVDWAGTNAISQYVTSYIKTLSASDKDSLVAEIKRNKAYIAPFNARPKGSNKSVPLVGNTAIEDMIIYVGKAKGNASKGKKIIAKVGCVACHNITPKDVVKAPDLAKLGHMSKDEIAEAILKPGNTIAPSWVNITMKDGAIHMGTMIKKDAKQIVVNNIAGMSTKLDAKQVKAIAPGLNMMSLHLVDGLKLQEFADLIEYLQSMDPKRKK